MIFPLPRTGPSRRCRLQLTTNVRLSRPSVAAMWIRPRDSGSSISPSPRNAQTCWSAVSRDAAVAQVAVEPRLHDRVHRAEAHRDRGELPEVRHEPRVRVRRQPVARPAVRQLLAEPVEPVLGQPPLQVRAGVDAGGGVALDVDLVTPARVVLAPEEVVEADLVERGRRRVGRDVAAHTDARPLRAVHRHRGVPADPAAVGALGLLVAGEPRLPVGGDRVDVVRAGQRGDADVALPGALQHPQHQVAGALLPCGVEHRVEGVEPLGRLLGVDVRQVGGEPVADDVHTPRTGPGVRVLPSVVWPVKGSPCLGSC